MALGFLVVALVGAPLAVVVVKSDVLTGRASPVARPSDTCAREVPEVAPDPEPAPAGVAVSNVREVLPLPTISGLKSAVMVHRNDYATPDEYLHWASLPRPGPVKAAMVANGFRSAASVGYEARPTVYGAEAFQFGSPQQAASFQRRSLLDACRDGLAGHIRPLPGHAGGFLFDLRATGLVAQRATFLIGDSVVRIGLCVCAEYPARPSDLLTIWARNTDARFRIPPP